MQAFIWHSNGEAELVEKVIPKIKSPRDAIVKVKLSSICTSDLHIINGAVPRAIPETVLGHEFVGEIVGIGNAITNLKVGDRVAANCETFCGECFFCKRGFVNNCEYGGWEIGCRIDGCQAEYVRVPFADSALTKLPDNVSYQSALFVGDILSSGYWSAELCEILHNSTIAIIGAGPVGLCSMLCAKHFGAGQIIAIDINPVRLNTARQNNLADYYVNPNECSVESFIKSVTQNRGADAVIEAAGADNTFEMAWKIARPNAIVVLTAMYENAQVLPLPEMYGKNLTFKTGGVDASKCETLINLISKNKINTDFLVTHTFPLSEIKKAYDLFKKDKDQCLKIVITN